MVALAKFDDLLAFQRQVAASGTFLHTPFPSKPFFLFKTDANREKVRIDIQNWLNGMRNYYFAN